MLLLWVLRLLREPESMTVCQDSYRSVFSPRKLLPHCAPKAQPRTRVFWLQGVTLAWMFVEFGVSAYAATTAHSSGNAGLRFR